MRRSKHNNIGFFTLTMLLTVSLLCIGSTFAAQSPQIPLASSAIPQFMQQLPTLATNTQSIPKISTILGNTALTIRMCEFNAQVLPPPLPPTRVWGYIAGPCPATTAILDTYIGPVIVNNRGTSTDITWVNELGSTATTGVLAWLYSTDQTLHWADPLNMEMNNCNMTGGIPEFGSPCAQNYSGPIPGVVHLHGGEVPPELDGGPDAWYTSDGAYQGHGYYTFSPAGIPATAGNAALYRYPNTQEAAPIWFHDHTLGATRLNVYAGLAGAYFIQDPALNLPANLHPLTEVVPIVLQDRMFDANGQFFFQADSAGGILWATNPEHPYWSPEFIGDTIVVNGKAWPYLNVQQKRYRFLFLNGSNARTYEMNLVDPVTKLMGPPMWVIGTDGGYLDTPVKIDFILGQKLLMQPGERYEVIIDFNDPVWLASFTRKTGPFSGTLILNNTGRTPFPKGASPQGSTLGRIMQFRVALGAVADTSYNPASGAPLRSGTQVIKRLVNPAAGTLATGVTAAKTRQLTLNEVMGMPWTGPNPVTGVTTAYPGGPLEILVNNTKWSGTNRPDFTPITVGGITTYYSELPKEGDTEVWEIVNLTADAHPIHLHLVQFQLINRQAFSVNTYTAAYNAAFPGGLFIPAYGPPLDYNTGNPRALGGNPDIAATNVIKGKTQPLYLQGTVRPPAPNEAGWKDTVITYPGEVTRLAVRWAPTDLPTTAAASSLYFPFDPSDFNGHGYVWHCHIIDHEDNEMMRPDVVDLNPAAPAPPLRPLKIGINY